MKFIPYPFWKKILLKTALFAPQSWRMRYGLLSWEELIEMDQRDYFASKKHFSALHPAARLVKMGIDLPYSKKAWPKHMEESAQSWNREGFWQVNLEGLHAWIKAWEKHPSRQSYLNQCLAAVCGSSQPSHVGPLLDAGADPNGSSKRTGLVLRQLMSFHDCSGIVNCLSVMRKKGAQLDWNKLIDGKEDHRDLFYKVKWTRAELDNLETLELDIPRGIWIRLASVFVEDPKIVYEPNESELEALKWFLEPHRFDQDAAFRSTLIQTFLSTARFNEDPSCHLSANYYWSVLVKPSEGLPEIKNQSWGEVWVNSPFPEGMPNRIVDQILNHPSSLKNLSTIAKLFEDKIEDKKRSNSLYGYPQGLTRLLTIQSKMQQHELDESTPNIVSTSTYSKPRL